MQMVLQMQMRMQMVLLHWQEPLGLPASHHQSNTAGRAPVLTAVHVWWHCTLKSVKQTSTHEHCVLTTALPHALTEEKVGTLSDHHNRNTQQQILPFITATREQLIGTGPLGHKAVCKQ
jgi:hypothetical protein